MNDISIYDLTYYALAYSNIDINRPITRNEKIVVFKQLASLMKKHWTSDEIFQVLLNNKGRLDINSLETLFNNRKPTKFNLLIPHRIYFHNELRLSSKPAVIEFNYNTGEYKEVQEPYFLEMKFDYTMYDLTSYFLKKQNLYEKDILRNNKRFIGSFNWLLKNYDIELILYMIDCCNDNIEFANLKRLTTPMDIQKYFIEAKDIYTRKINECKQIGGGKIVQRVRDIEHYRNGMVDQQKRENVY